MLQIVADDVVLVADVLQMMLQIMLQMYNYSFYCIFIRYIMLQNVLQMLQCVADNFDEIYQKLVLQFVADTNIWELQQEVQQNCCRLRALSATSATISATQKMA